ncbi:xylulose kinase [Eurytemora carolleeae]|uniref:xylulose kinase n=1 Tax=Eurytemora carolleeae TaxID=1294199 RepID=UPI000C78F4B3|nr:xylulose kinase [Eurytemora carolleeae]|eukprot:XP_023332715.1 xylulose kinase-like [Eurytemora affinis]
MGFSTIHIKCSPFFSMDDDENPPDLFIGLDFSTQQIKAVVINTELQVVAEAFVQFDSMLPEFRTQGGVHISGSTVTAPTLMWVKGLDILLEKLRVEGVDLSRVGGISGAGQQHGSIYWRPGVEQVLRDLQPDRFLHDQLSSGFSIPDSPVWMDSSTNKQCQQLEEHLGGPETLTALTGSRAYHRFTGNQIAKIREEKQEAYDNTERISLVSSFAASLFVGRVVGIDWSDGAGMNILNITNKQWVPQILTFLGEGLEDKLGSPVPTDSVVGTVSPYMQERYGFNPTCIVGAFTGDNPSSLAGLCLHEGDIGYSLGTSDTIFVWVKEPNPQLTGSIFPNPVDPAAYMAMLCYKNGSLTREKFRDSNAGGCWTRFNNLLESTPRGNFGNLGFYFTLPEIVPAGIQGDFRFNKSDEPVLKFASEETEIR